MLEVSSPLPAPGTKEGLSSWWVVVGLTFPCADEVIDSVVTPDSISCYNFS